MSLGDCLSGMTLSAESFRVENQILFNVSLSSHLDTTPLNEFEFQKKLPALPETDSGPTGAGWMCVGGLRCMSRGFSS